MRTIRNWMGIVLALVVLLGVALTAQAQETINIGDTVTGTRSGSAIEYTLNATAKTVLLISAMSDAFDAELDVKDAAGNEIASDSDSGENYNALLALLVPEDGVYTIVVDSWLSSGSGDFTLSVTEAVADTLTYGATTEVAFNNETIRFMVFEGTEGDILHIWGDCGQADMDTRFTLIGPDNQEIASDDGGVDTNPALVRVMLPVTGTYLIKTTTFFDELVTGVLFVTVEEAELLSLDGGPITITLGERFDYDILRFSANANGRYRLTVTSVGPAVTIEAQIGSDDWSAPGIDMTNALRASLDFFAPATELTDVRLSGWFYNDMATVEVTIEAVE